VKYPPATDGRMRMLIGKCIPGDNSVVVKLLEKMSNF
jgi:hypothetical protein